MTSQNVLETLPTLLQWVPIVHRCSGMPRRQRYVPDRVGVSQSNVDTLAMFLLWHQNTHLWLIMVRALQLSRMTARYATSATASSACFRTRPNHAGDLRLQMNRNAA